MATDFLLLAHAHGCEEFEGMRYFNLSSKSQNIHASLAGMKRMVHSIEMETEGWLENAFNTSISEIRLSVISPRKQKAG